MLWAVMAPIAALTAACGAEAKPLVESPSPGVTKLASDSPDPELSCPEDMRSSGTFDAIAGAEGARSPRAAVAGYGQDGQSVLVSHDGSDAWVLRADGTAYLQLGLVRPNGWLVNETTGC